MKRKNEILKLRNQGKSYKTIQKLLNCSLSVISYHCGIGQKEKTISRKEKRGFKTQLSQKVNRFNNEFKKYITRTNKQNWKLNIRDKIQFFNKKGVKSNMKLTLKNVLQKITKNPKCYLTGRLIDITKTSSYHFDHIIPISQGGDNSLSNFNIACKDANQAKSGMFLNDFIQLCIEVLTTNGYTITKNS